MKRKRQSGPGLAVNLFPFLAVLICTMGVLILMLVMAVKSSEVRAAEARMEQQQQISGQREQLLDQLDLEQFRVDEIGAMRPDLLERLAGQRERRSHLEDEIRQIRQQAEDLERQFNETDSDVASTAATRRDRWAEIARLEETLERRARELKELAEQAADRQLLYSIVPTETSRGTSRRPIYVECRPDGIRLQPAGILIPLNEFTIPVVAGNPLDAALLATREFWNRNDVARVGGDPYPLLVVRPGGASAYAIARRAMKSWDDEFGYELVENTIELDWGEVNTGLKRTLEHAIHDARRRQKHLVATSRVQWIGREHLGSAGMARGGGEAVGLPGADSTTGGPGQLAGSGPRATGNREGIAGGSVDHSVSGVQPARSAPAGSGATGLAAGNVASLGDGSPRGTGKPPGTPDGQTAGGQTAGGPQQAQTTGPRGIGDRPQAPLAHPASIGPGTAADGSANGPITAQSTPDRGQGNPALRAHTSDLGQHGSPSSGSSSGRGGSGQSDERSAPSSAIATPACQVTPLSETRGQNWALPTRTPGATGYRRPIRIDCREGEFTVHNSDPSRLPVPVPVPGSIDHSVDALIHQIWKQIEDWGMAESGGYWKPVLRIHVLEGGERQADVLTGKLRGSGLEIERVR